MVFLPFRRVQKRESSHIFGLPLRGRPLEVRPGGKHRGKEKEGEKVASTCSRRVRARKSGKCTSMHQEGNRLLRCRKKGEKEENQWVQGINSEAAVFSYQIMIITLWELVSPPVS